MTIINKYINRSRISEAKFRHLLQLFCLDIDAHTIAIITGLSRYTVNRHFRLIRERIDEYTRECLAIDIGRKLNKEDVLERLTSLFVCRGIPEHIRSDNGSEFTAKAVRSWLQRLGIKTLYIEHGSPWENGYIESFNGKLRDELLNGEIFDTLFEAKVLVERWRREYNHIRPHSSLGYKTPAPEAVMPIDSLLLFGSATLHLSTTATQNSVP